MQLKITMGYHLMSGRMVTLKKTAVNVSKDVEKSKVPTVAGDIN